MSDSSQFLFAVCQRGSEAVLKSEIACRWPDLRPAYSRQGFVTFKASDGQKFAEDFDLQSVFARAYGCSLGKVEDANAEQLADEFWNVAPLLSDRHLHVWQRDTAVPGDFGFEPGNGVLAGQIAAVIARRRPADLSQRPPLQINRPARPGQRVLDCVLVEPNQWWIGFHRAASVCSCWPGGVIAVKRPPEAVSRAYLKMAEALSWSRLPLDKNDLCVEIGSAPGGSCQALLDRGLRVIGIDPAEMDEGVLVRPNFVHLRKRVAEVKRRTFRGVRWLTADSNVAPNHTLDSVEAIVTSPHAHVRGMLLTLKLLQWELAHELRDYIRRIRSWGYEYVKARQLAHNRQEVCVMALRRRSMRREPSWKTHARRMGK